MQETAPKKQFALVILCTADAEVLFQLRDDIPTISHPNHWGLFGGRIESSEQPHHAALREIREELSLDLCERRMTDHGAFRYEPGKVHYVFSYKLGDELESAQLSEGQRFAAFSQLDITGGKIEHLSVVLSHLRMLETFWRRS